MPIPLHPYVARGEINARDLITSWFCDAAFEEIDYAASRVVSDKDSRWEHSLILFGSAAVNRFVKKVLRRYPALPIQRLSRTQFRVDRLLEELGERDRLQTANSEGQCLLTMDEPGCILEVDPGKRWLRFS